MFCVNGMLAPSVYALSISSFIKKWALWFPSLWMTSERESNHSLVSNGSISPLFITWIVSGFSFSIFLIGSFCSRFFFKEFSASCIKFSVFFGTSFEEERFWSIIDISKIKSPFETLSPTFTAIDSILPEKIDGISTLDLSLSIVITGSFFLIYLPSLTNN